jgi:hypothetical protein
MLVEGVITKLPLDAFVSAGSGTMLCAFNRNRLIVRIANARMCFIMAFWEYPHNLRLRSIINNSFSCEEKFALYIQA